MPPVTVGGSKYMDGGVNSGTNALLAAGCERVVIIAPIGARSEGLGNLAGRQLAREADELRAGGSAVTLIQPDGEALEAFGLNLMDAARVLPALQAGWRQGAAAAGKLKGLWA